MPIKKIPIINVNIKEWQNWKDKRKQDISYLYKEYPISTTPTLNRKSISRKNNVSLTKLYQFEEEEIHNILAKYGEKVIISGKEYIYFPKYDIFMGKFLDFRSRIRSSYTKFRKEIIVPLIDRLLKNAD